MKKLISTIKTTEGNKRIRFLGYTSFHKNKIFAGSTELKGVHPFGPLRNKYRELCAGFLQEFASNSESKFEVKSRGIPRQIEDILEPGEIVSNNELPYIDAIWVTHDRWIYAGISNYALSKKLNAPYPVFALCEQTSRSALLAQEIRNSFHNRDLPTLDQVMAVGLGLDSGINVEQMRVLCTPRRGSTKVSLNFVSDRYFMYKTLKENSDILLPNEKGYSNFLYLVQQRKDIRPEMEHAADRRRFWLQEAKLLSKNRMSRIQDIFPELRKDNEAFEATRQFGITKGNEILGKKRGIESDSLLLKRKLQESRSVISKQPDWELIKKRIEKDPSKDACLKELQDLNRDFCSEISVAAVVPLVFSVVEFQPYDVLYALMRRYPTLSSSISEKMASHSFTGRSGKLR